MKEEPPSAPVVDELFTHADDDLAADTVESLIETAINETVEAISGVEVKEETPSDPELVTQEAENLAVETVESMVEADVSVTVDASSGVEVKEESL